jgi:hypothetical protein
MSEIATGPLPATTKQLDAVSKPASSYNLAIGYLRAFITVLVLAHHAVLAYHPFAPPMAASLVTQPRWWQAFPVVDNQRWSGFAWFVGLNDVFFMSLMFLLSGLFVWKSLVRKGSAGFLRDRVLRLGLPFVVSAALIAPLAYYPTYLLTGTSTGLAGFWHDWRSLGSWPAGPAWFVWVLLAFDCMAAALLVLIPNWGEALGRGLSGVSRRPIVFFALLVAISALAYVRWHWSMVRSTGSASDLSSSRPVGLFTIWSIFSSAPVSGRTVSSGDSSRRKESWHGVGSCGAWQL